MLGVIARRLLIPATLLAAQISPYDPLAIDLRQRNQAPGPSHWLGTDGNGRDMLARVLFGRRVSLSVGLISVSISTLLGIAIGSLAGYFGGVADMLLMRLTDIFMAFPLLVVVIALVAITGPGIYSSMFAIGVLSWPSMARLVRAQFLTLRGVEFTQAARCLGIPSSRIILRHVLPNTVDTVVVAVTLRSARPSCWRRRCRSWAWACRSPRPAGQYAARRADDLDPRADALDVAAAGHPDYAGGAGDQLYWRWPARRARPARQHAGLETIFSK